MDDPLFADEEHRHQVHVVDCTTINTLLISLCQIRFIDIKFLTKEEILDQGHDEDTSWSAPPDLIVIGHFDCDERACLSLAHEVGHCMASPGQALDKMEQECSAWAWAVAFIKSVAPDFKFSPLAIEWAIDQLRTYERYYQNAGGAHLQSRDRQTPPDVLRTLWSLT